MTMEQYISKSAVKAEIEKCYNECLKRAKIIDSEYWNAKADAYLNALVILDNTLEVKEVDIASMADDYYDALMEEAAVWMDEGTMGHCRLAYYNGCKDVLNKLQKGE